MTLLSILLWVVGIYLFIAILIFYALVNNIFFFRSSAYDIEIEGGEVESLYLEDPRIRYHLVTHQGQTPTKWVILLHSWGRNSARMMTRGRIYFQQGYSLLLVDAPGHGQSQWVPVIMGTDYAKYTKQICDKHQITQPVVHGLSFGSIAAVLFANQVEVRAVVAEALISNFEEMYEGFFRSLHLPKPLYGWIPWLILQFGFEWDELAPVNLLPKSDYPLFLIHGAEDTMFYPEKHYEQNLVAMGDRDKLFTWIVPGSPHSRMARYDGYTDKLNEFIEYIDQLQ